MKTNTNRRSLVYLSTSVAIMITISVMLLYTYLASRNRNVIDPLETVEHPASNSSDVVTASSSDATMWIEHIGLKPNVPSYTTNNNQPVADLNTANSEASEYSKPLASLNIDDQKTRALYNAEQVLLKECMNARGFDYFPYSYDDDVKQEASHEKIVLGDVGTAQVRGYGIAESIASSNRDGGDFASDEYEHSALLKALDPNNNLLQTMHPDQQQEWDTALIGSVGSEDSASSSSVKTIDLPGIGSVSWDSNSCMSQAKRELFGSDIVAKKNQIARFSLKREVLSATENDLEYQIALEQWRNCMSGYGYEFQKPGEVQEMLYDEYFSGTLDLESLQTRETTIATIDASCYSELGVGDIYLEAMQRAEAMFLDNYSMRVEELRNALLSAASRAESYLQ